MDQAYDTARFRKSRGGTNKPSLDGSCKAQTHINWNRAERGKLMGPRRLEWKERAKPDQRKLTYHAYRRDGKLRPD